MKILKYILVFAVVFSLLVVPITALAYDETVVTTAPLDAVQMYRSDGKTWVQMPFSNYNNTFYSTYTVPPVTAVKFVFTITLERSFQNVQLDISYDFSGIPGYGQFTVSALYRGTAVPSNIVDNGNSVTINATANDSVLSNSMQFDVTVNNVIADNDNMTDIYWGRSATVSYDIAADFSSAFDDSTSKVNGLTSDLGNLESSAMGGKSDDDLNSEIDGVLGENPVDSLKSSKISSFIEGCLDAFGKEYKSLLLFSCSIGLCIFVIGRRAGT